MLLLCVDRGKDAEYQNRRGEKSLCPQNKAGISMKWFRIGQGIIRGIVSHGIRILPPRIGKMERILGK